MNNRAKWTTAEEVIKNAKNIAFYGRVSTDEQDVASQQIATVKQYLSKFGKRLANLPDEKEGKIGDVISAYSQPYSKRDDFMDILEALGDETYDALIVSDRDRLSRQTDEHFELRDRFNKLGIPVIIASQNDLYNTENFLKNLIEDALTKLESDNISVRTKATLKAMLQQEMYIGGHPPFGYRMARDSDKNSRVIAFEEKLNQLGMVEEMFRDYIRGETFTSITNKLKEKHVEINWSVTKVKSIILNPIYAGFLFYNRYAYKGKKRSFKPIDQWISFPSKLPIKTVIKLEEWWFCWQKYELQKDKPPRY